MAEPKKQDLIEQYEELVKKRHALEAKKQFAVTMGVADVALPGASAARGAYKSRKALGAAGEVAGAARVGEEAAYRSVVGAGKEMDAAGLAAREAESGLEAARARSAESTGQLSETPTTPMIPDQSADVYRHYMQKGSGDAPMRKQPVHDDNPWEDPESVHYPLTQAYADEIKADEFADFFLRPASEPYAKAQAKLRFIDSLEDRYKSVMKETFGFNDAELAKSIEEDGMKAGFLRGHQPDFIEKLEKRTGVKYGELSPPEATSSDLRVLRDYANSEVEQAGKALEARQEELADYLLAREQRDWARTGDRNFSLDDQLRLQRNEEQIQELIIERSVVLEHVESLETIYLPHLKKELKAASPQSWNAEQLKRQIGELEKSLDRDKAEVAAFTKDLNTRLSEMPSEYPLIETMREYPKGDSAPYSMDELKGAFRYTTDYDLPIKHTKHLDLHRTYGRYGAKIDPSVFSSAARARMPVKAAGYRQQTEDLLREAHGQHFSNLRGEAKKRQAYEAAEEGLPSKKQAYEAARAERVAARTKSFTAGMSAEDIAKQYAMARGKVGAMFTPVVGAAVEWREADQELAKVNAQLKALTEGASPKDRVRLEDYLMSEGSPAQEEDDLKWGEPTEEPPE